MKLSIFSMLFCSVFLTGTLQAAEHPAGSIVIHNASDTEVSAQISSFAKFDLPMNESKNVAYRTLSYACSSTPTNCKANFFVRDIPAGFATINVETGKLINLNLPLKVHTAKDTDNVLRGITIQ